MFASRVKRWLLAELIELLHSLGLLQVVAGSWDTLDVITAYRGTR
jgi:hypothetical protein